MGKSVRQVGWAWCIGVAAAVVLAGCVSAERGAAKAPPVPQGLIPSRMLVNANEPQDRDGDATPDVISMIVYFFAFAPNPVGVEASGTLRFVLTGGGELLAEWEIPEAQYAPARSLLGAGIAYPLELRLPRFEPGQAIPETATLSAAFLPSGEGDLLRAASVEFRLRR